MPSDGVFACGDQRAVQTVSLQEAKAVALAHGKHAAREKVRRNQAHIAWPPTARCDAPSHQRFQKLIRTPRIGPQARAP